MSLKREVTEEVGLALERLDLAAGAVRALVAEDGCERMAYVVGGSGRAIVDGAEHPLATESVVWLEPGDRCTVIGGDDGLALLVAGARIP